MRRFFVALLGTVLVLANPNAIAQGNGSVQTQTNGGKPTTTTTAPGGGGGGGSPSVGSKYQFQTADGAGGIIPSNIKMDSTGNNLIIPGTISAAGEIFPSLAGTGILPVCIGNDGVLHTDISTCGSGGTNTPTNIQVGQTKTGNPGTQAVVQNTGTSTAPVFTFTIPSGLQGLTGQAGTNGLNGAKGDTGATGQVGQTGQQGLQGIQGLAGQAGAKGDTGTQGIQGIPGVAGVNGQAGAAGESAYQQAVDNGFSGNQQQWLASLQGVQGIQGQQGIQGPPGAGGGGSGTAATIAIGNVTSGANAAVTNSGSTSAAVFNFVLQQGIQGIQGVQGIKGDTGTAGTNGAVGATGQQGLQGVKGDTGIAGLNGQQGVAGTNGTNGANGADGISAYQVAVANGFSGSQQQWLATLQGAPGTAGTNGANGQQGLPGTNGTNGTNGVNGAAGISAYQVAVNNGFSGNQTSWLASLQGATGQQGVQGLQGTAGANGTNGTNGITPSFSIASVNTGAPGSTATVALGGTAANPTLAFSIPQGAAGTGGGNPDGVGGASTLTSQYSMPYVASSGTLGQLAFPSTGGVPSFSSSGTPTVLVPGVDLATVGNVSSALSNLLANQNKWSNPQIENIFENGPTFDLNAISGMPANPGTTDATAVVQAFINSKVTPVVPTCGNSLNAVSTICGTTYKVTGKVMLSQLKLPSYTRVLGIGENSSLLFRAPNSTGPFIVTADNTSTVRVSIQDISINGNYYNQTLTGSSAATDCVQFDSSKMANDTNHSMHHVRIDGCSGWGFNDIGSWGEGQYDDLYVQRSFLGGIFVATPDNKWSNITTDENTGVGLQVAAANNYMVNGKSWYNGNNLYKVDSSGNNTTTPSQYVYCFQPSPGVITSGGRNQLIGWNVQDNCGNGAELGGDSQTFAGWLADGNGKYNWTTYQNDVIAGTQTAGQPFIGPYLYAGAKFAGLSNSYVQITSMNHSEQSGSTPSINFPWQSLGFDFTAEASQSNHNDFYLRTPVGAYNSTTAIFSNIIGPYSGYSNQSDHTIINGEQITPFNLGPAQPSTASSSPRNSVLFNLNGGYFDGTLSQETGSTLQTVLGSGATPSSVDLQLLPNALAPTTTYFTLTPNNSTFVAGTTANLSSLIQRFQNSYTGTDGKAHSAFVTEQAVIASGTTPITTMLFGYSGAGSLVLQSAGAVTATTSLNGATLNVTGASALAALTASTITTTGAINGATPQDLANLHAGTAGGGGGAATLPSGTGLIYDNAGTAQIATAAQTAQALNDGSVNTDVGFRQAVSGNSFTDTLPTLDTRWSHLYSLGGLIYYQGLGSSTGVRAPFDQAGLNGLLASIDPNCGVTGYGAYNPATGKCGPLQGVGVSTVTVSGSTISPTTTLVILSASAGASITTINPLPGWSAAGCTTNCIGGQVTFIFPNTNAKFSTGGNIPNGFTPPAANTKVIYEWVPQQSSWI